MAHTLTASSLRFWLPGIVVGLAALCPGAMASQIYTVSYLDGSNQLTGAHGGQIVGDGITGHALLWPDVTAGPTDLHVSPYSQTYAKGTNGAQQIGYTSDPMLGYHALLWSGSASSVVDLNPSGITSAWGFGIGGTEQVGWGSGSSTGNSFHALRWSGTASSMVDLHPSAYTDSHAYGTNGSQEAGYATTSGGAGHAMLWSGTAATAVDLNPAGVNSSLAFAIAGNQQAGRGDSYAYLWTGSAASAINLHPNGYGTSDARATNGSQQAGFASDAMSGRNHAFVWSGTASSGVDLHAFLPGGWRESWAYAIDEQGRVFGKATDSLNRPYAAVWTPVVPVPEPTMAGLLLLAVSAIALRRPRRGR